MRDHCRLLPARQRAHQLRLSYPPACHRIQKEWDAKLFVKRELHVRDLDSVSGCNRTIKKNLQKERVEMKSPVESQKEWFIITLNGRSPQGTRASIHHGHLRQIELRPDDPRHGHSAIKHVACRASATSSASDVDFSCQTRSTTSKLQLE
jgi:hypothetical protein